MIITLLEISTPLLLGILGQILMALVALTVTFFFKKKQKTHITKPLSARLTELTSSLNKSTKEVDFILQELISVAKNKEEAVIKLERALSELESREVQVKKRINDLQNVPIAVADHFAELSKDGERRSRSRDYLLFVAGVIFSIISSIILKKFGLG